MKGCLVSIIGTIGLGLGVAVSLFAHAIASGVQSNELSEQGNISLFWVAIGFVGLLFISKKPKFGGILLILSGLVVGSLMQPMGYIATIPLVLAGVIGMIGNKKVA